MVSKCVKFLLTAYMLLFILTASSIQTGKNSISYYNIYMSSQPDNNNMNNSIVVTATIEPSDVFFYNYTFTESLEHYNTTVSCSQGAYMRILDNTSRYIYAGIEVNKTGKHTCKLVVQSINYTRIIVFEVTVKKLEIRRVVFTDTSTLIEFRVEGFPLNGLTVYVNDTSGSYKYEYDNMYPVGEYTVEIPYKPSPGSWVIGLREPGNNSIDDYALYMGAVKEPVVVVTYRSIEDPDYITIHYATPFTPLRLEAVLKPSNIFYQLPYSNGSIKVYAGNNTEVVIEGYGYMRTGDYLIYADLYGVSTIPGKPVFTANISIESYNMLLGVGLGIGLTIMSAKVIIDVLRRPIIRNITRDIALTLVYLAGVVIVYILVSPVFTTGSYFYNKYNEAMSKIHLLMNTGKLLVTLYGLPVSILFMENIAFITALEIIEKAIPVAIVFTFPLKKAYGFAIHVLGQKLPEYTRRFITPFATTYGLAILLLYYVYAYIIFLYIIAVPLGYMIVALGIAINNRKLVVYGGGFHVMYVLFPLLYDSIISPVIDQVYWVIWSGLPAVVSASIVNSVMWSGMILYYALSDRLGFYTGVPSWFLPRMEEIIHRVMSVSYILHVYMNLILFVALIYSFTVMITVMVGVELTSVVSDELELIIKRYIIQPFQRIIRHMFHRLIFNP